MPWLVLLLGCGLGDCDDCGSVSGEVLEPPPHDERWRPWVHFTASQAWLNDPNGLVVHDGTWHLFYQHHPDSDLWGPMHWGHATSTDGVRWSHQPVALSPNEDGAAWSGSAVSHEGELLALYTRHTASAENQHLARLEGDLLVDVADGPVLQTPGLADFRDPKVFWHVDHWVMALAAGDHIELYTGPDLRTWTKASEVWLDIEGIQECPDLLQVNGRWVLIVSTNGGGPQGGSGAVYVEGDFDGASFTPTGAVDFLDWGSDFYAWQSWSGLEGAARGIAWMSNWDHAMRVPTEGFRGAMTLPRELGWVGPDDTRLRASFGVSTWELEPVRRPGGEEPAENQDGRVQIATEDRAAMFHVEVNPEAGTAVRLTLTAGASEVVVGIEPDGTGYIDRSRSGVVDFAEDFAARHEAPDVGGGPFLVVTDTSSIEVEFPNTTLTDQIFPDEAPWSAELEIDGATQGPSSMEAWALRHIHAE